MIQSKMLNILMDTSTLWIAQVRLQKKAHSQAFFAFCTHPLHFVFNIFTPQGVKTILTMTSLLRV